MGTNSKTPKHSSQPNGRGFLGNTAAILLLPLALLTVVYFTGSYYQIKSLNNEVSELKSSSISKEVLIFGDSITAGKPGSDGGWVGLLHQRFDLLRATNSETKNEPTVFNMGVSGDTSEDILKRIVLETTEKTYNHRLPIVVIQIGTNDSNGMPLKTYENNLKKIIKKLRPISSKIILVGLPACDETPSSLYCSGKHRTNESIKRFEDRMKTVATDENIEFIPVFDDFKNELDNGKDLLADGLHPNKSGYELMFEIISEKIIPQLTN